MIILFEIKSQGYIGFINKLLFADHLTHETFVNTMSQKNALLRSMNRAAKPTR
jgi:hypothetical protein